MAGFWKKRFEPPATTSQRVFDLIFGIVAPILCLVFDPAIFRGGFPAGSGYLSAYKPFAYTEIAVSIVALAYYLLRQKGSLLLAGILAGSGIFSLILGIFMLPMTFLGLFIFIGIFGLTPFVSSYVFLRNAYRSWRGSAVENTRGSAVLRVAVGFMLVVGIPLSTHVSYVHAARNALQAVQSGSEEDYVRAVHTLKLLRYDTDEIALRYSECQDEKRRDRLSRAFSHLTGQPVQVRLDELTD